MNIKISDYDLLMDSRIDEKGANGILDLSGDIAIQIGLSLKEQSIVPDNVTIFSEDFGQELIYSVFQEFKTTIIRSVSNEK